MIHIGNPGEFKGLKMGKIAKLKWKNLYKTNNEKKIIHYFKIKNNNVE